MNLFVKNIVAVTLLLLFQSCSVLQEDITCTASIEAGILLRIPDPDGVVESLSARVQDQDYIKEFEFVVGEGEVPERLENYELGFAPERKGVYDITVESPGFKKWSKEGVVVERGECHVITVTVEVNLITDDE